MLTPLSSGVVNNGFINNNQATGSSSSTIVLSPPNAESKTQPILSPPKSTLAAPSDLMTAETKVNAETASTGSTSISPERQADIKEKLDTATKPSDNEIATLKKDAYKKLALNLINLTGAIASTTMLAVTTAGTQGVTAPLLVVSTLILINAVINTTIATINVVRAHKGQPPLKLDVLIHSAVIKLLTKMNVPENIRDKLTVDMFTKMGAMYKISLNVAQIFLSLLSPVPVPAIIVLLSKIIPAVLTGAEKTLDVIVPDKPKEQRENEAIQKKFTEFLDSSEAQAMLRKHLEQAEAEAAKKATQPKTNIADPHQFA